MKVYLHLYVLLIAAVLSGCSDPAAVTPAGLNTAYEAALKKTSGSAVILGVDSADESEVLLRLEQFFTEMSADSVRAQTLDIYAPEAILYDNLAVIEGSESIRSYFIKAASEVDQLDVEFLQVSRDGADYFIRWRMIMGSEALSSGEPIVSYGMSQFRFDASGRVLLHRDFWDAATGLYEHLPVIGGLLQRLRAFLAGGHES
jgi:hypothetical protein